MKEMKKFYVTVLSNFSKAYDKYTNRYSKGGIKANFPDKFFLLDRDCLNIGIEKNKRLLARLGNPSDRIIVMESLISDPLYNDHETGIGHYVKRSYIVVDKVYFWIDGDLQEVGIEDVMAQSLALQQLKPYEEIKPRTVSLLPVAKGCQAACSFCFSTASVSTDFKGRVSDFKLLETQLKAAAKAGAERAVITGGGEPTLLPEKQLLQSGNGSRLISKLKSASSLV